MCACVYEKYDVKPGGRGGWWRAKCFSVLRRKNAAWGGAVGAFWPFVKTGSTPIGAALSLFFVGSDLVASENRNDLERPTSTPTSTPREPCWPEHYAGRKALQGTWAEPWLRRVAYSRGLHGESRVQGAMNPGQGERGQKSFAGFKRLPPDEAKEHWGCWNLQLCSLFIGILFETA